MVHRKGARSKLGFTNINFSKFCFFLFHVAHVSAAHYLCLAKRCLGGAWWWWGGAGRAALVPGARSVCARHGEQTVALPIRASLL